MHPLNKLRLQAGLVIDSSLEKTIKVTEAREVPRSRSDLKKKSPESLAAHVAGITKAIIHLKNAVKSLERIPAHDFNGDVPYYIHEIENLLSSDGGSVGLDSLLSSFQTELKGTEPAVTESVNLSEDHFKKGELIVDKDGYDWIVKGFTGEGDDEMYKLECPKSGKKKEKKFSKTWKKSGKTLADFKEEKVTEEFDDMTDYENEEQQPAKFDTSREFKEGEKVIYDNGIWIVHLADTKADLVGIIPPSMRDASDGEKAKAMQQVKREKIRKPSEEECEIMAGSSMPAMESTQNYTQSNAQSFEDNDNNDPINSVAQAKNQWVNSYNPREVKNEYTTQLDNRGEQSDDEYTDKVKVPTKVKTALKDAIAAFESDAAKSKSGHSGTEMKQFCTDAAAAFRELLGMLDGGTIMDIKKAQVYASSLMGPMLHKLPTNVWDFIVNGGQARSLKDYMAPVDKKFPKTGPTEK